MEETGPDIAEILETSDVFRGLRWDQRKAISNLGRWLALSTGKYLFGAGERAGSVYLLVRGMVALELPFKESQYVVDILGCGQVLGWSALRHQANYGLSARATMEGKALAFDGLALRTLLISDLEMAVVVYRNLTEIAGRRLEDFAASVARSESLSLAGITHPLMSKS